VAADGHTVLDEEDDDVIMNRPDAGSPTCSADLATETVNCKCSCLYLNRTDGSVYERSPCDSKNNTYRCLRTINSTTDDIYCEFDDPEQFVEYYDISSDPFNRHNLAYNLSTAAAARYGPDTSLHVPAGLPDKLAWFHSRLRDFMECRGHGCWDPAPAPPPPPPSIKCASCGSSLLNNTGWEGPNLGHQTAASAEDCCAACVANPSCAKWAFHGPGSGGGARCVLQPQGSTVTKKDGVAAGVLNRSAALA
jgi:hypothetical protein